MAQLIPSFMDDHTPPGERAVFNLIAGGPDDWVVFHSLDLAPWNRGLRTEVDFIVVIPDMGILCVEVKSQPDISFDGHRWHPPAIKRSPFKQATDARYTFGRRLRDIAPGFEHVPVAHCCIFPKSCFSIHENLSVQPWELIDATTFESFSGAGQFCEDLRERLKSSIDADSRLHPLDIPLSPAQLKQIVSLCVPVQNAKATAREEIRRREIEVEKILRTQQKPVLALASMNPRLLVSGGAGTGKTLIAMELARRAAETGKRVGLFFFNQIIGDHIRRRVRDGVVTMPNLIAGRGVQLMAEMAGIEIPSSPGADYWDRELPQQIEDRLTDPDFCDIACFDYLVIDEGQDFLSRPRLWQCISHYLLGGIAAGSFAMIGDFDHQVLSERDAMNVALAALESASRPVKWKLEENCRNYRVVGETAVHLGGITDRVYTGYMRTGGGQHNYNIAFYDGEEHQLQLLAELLKQFKSDGYRPSEITLLSFRADDASAAARLKAAGHKLRSARESGDQTSFASVHAFKGMENKVIILTDVVLKDTEFHRDLFYTGLTRTTESVRVLCSLDSKATILDWIMAGRSLA